MANEWNRGTFTIDASGSSHTVSNFILGLKSFLTQVGWSVATGSVLTSGSEDYLFLRTNPTENDTWHYTGDFGSASPQYGGLRVKRQTATTTDICCYLQNTGGTGSQRSGIDIGAVGKITCTFDTTAPNIWTIIGGEHGLCIHGGTNGNSSNLGIGIIGTFLEVPEWYPAYGNISRKWQAQGFSIDLKTALNAATGNSTGGPRNPSSGRAFRAGTSYPAVRGSTSGVTATPANDVYIGISNRIHRFSNLGGYTGSSTFSGGVGVATPAWQQSLFSLGFSLSPINGKYTISPLTAEPGQVSNIALPATSYATGAAWYSASGATPNIDTGSGNQGCFALDYREIRQVKKFFAVDSTLLPWTTIQDSNTNTYYWVIAYTDPYGVGFPGNLAVEWPTITPISIAVT